MVRHVNPHKNIIKKIMSNDYNRLSDEGAKSLSLDRKNKSNTKTYNLNQTSNSNIIITKTRVTNLELVNRTVQELEFYLSEYMLQPLIISQPLTYIECKSILNGKYNNILKKIDYTVNQIYYNSTDRKAAFHTSALLQNVIQNSAGISLNEYATKGVKSIQTLFKGLQWFIDRAENAQDGINRTKKYNVNYVFYEILNRS